MLFIWTCLILRFPPKLETKRNISFNFILHSVLFGPKQSARQRSCTGHWGTSLSSALNRYFKVSRSMMLLKTIDDQALAIHRIHITYLLASSFPYRAPENTTLSQNVGQRVSHHCSATLRNPLRDVVLWHLSRHMWFRHSDPPNCW